jgi:hypothetical protein
VCSFSLLLVLLRFMAYDRHMNLVLGDAEEFRKLPPKKGSKEEVRLGDTHYWGHLQWLVGWAGILHQAEREAGAGQQ